MLELRTPIQYVKGIGPRVSAILNEKGMSTVEDLLYYLPFRYEDRANPKAIAELKPGQTASIIAEVRTSHLYRTKSGMSIFELVVGQHTKSIVCTWFHGTYLKDRFKPGQMLALYGKVEQGWGKYSKGRLQLMQPQVEVLGVNDEDPEDLLSERLENSVEIGRIVPVYEAIGKLNSRWFRNTMHRILKDLVPELPDGIPAAVRQQMQLMGRREAFERAHFPLVGESFADLERRSTPAHRRLIFEELFFLELGLELKRRNFRRRTGISFALTDQVREAIKRFLPFRPTGAQKKVLAEIAEDMRTPVPMRRLLQGDVGSGKTLVALEAAVIGIENGYQAALMAPTEILATQHYLSARKLLEPHGYRVVLLTGSLEEERKRATRRHIAQGNAQLVIGTHALIEEKVEFAKLGLIVVDEQHRFGVMQRWRLMRKPNDGGEHNSPQQAKGHDFSRGDTAASNLASKAAVSPGTLEPDVLVMTATPIPRTLALTLYGDLDGSTLDELPPGRTPIITRRVTGERAPDVWDFIRKQVAQGRQAYVVYPVIESAGEEGDPIPLDVLESQRANGKQGKEEPTAARGRAFARSTGKAAKIERPRQSSLRGIDLAAKKSRSERTLHLKSATSMYEELRERVFSDLRVGLLHGRLSADEKDLVMARFQRGEIDVLVATTVVEVGVDVPNASVMVIEHAERFGLSQLHQLRGRIGRGAHKSYCVLMTAGKISPEGERRLEAMVKTQDGFAIAELDLELRGPGEFFGTKQAGAPSLRVANLIRDRKLLEMARTAAQRIVHDEQGCISKTELSTVMFHLKSHWQRTYGLVEVG